MVMSLLIHYSYQISILCRKLRHSSILIITSYYYDITLFWTLNNNVVVPKAPIFIAASVCSIPSFTAKAPFSDTT
jgi:hypothetical protein